MKHIRMGGLCFTDSHRTVSHDDVPALCAVVFPIVAVLAKVLKVVMVKKHRRIVDIVHINPFTMMHDVARLDDALHFASFTKAAHSADVFNSAMLPCFAVIECSLLCRCFRS